VISLTEEVLENSLVPMNPVEMSASDGVIGGMLSTAVGNSVGITDETPGRLVDSDETPSTNDEAGSLVWLDKDPIRVGNELLDVVEVVDMPTSTPVAAEGSREFSELMAGLDVLGSSKTLELTSSMELLGN